MVVAHETTGDPLAQRLGPLRAPTALAVAGVATAGAAAVVVWVGAAVGFPSVAFAFALNWVAMCWMGIVARIWPPRLPDGYYAIRPFERNGRVYELAGVRIIKIIVRRGPLHLFNSHLRLPGEPTVERLGVLERRMREPEAAHLVLFAIMLPFVALVAVRGSWWAAAWTMLFNVVLNAYPVMLQRYNRRWLLDRITASPNAV